MAAGDRFTHNGTRTYCAAHRYGDQGGLPCPGCSTTGLLTVLLEGGERWTRIAREVPIPKSDPPATHWTWADPSVIKEGVL